MANSQNGYSAISSSQTAKWIIPISGTKKHLILRPGHTGFLLAHFALWFHEEVESLTTQKEWDDWGWAYRPVRGFTVLSNHASGTAMDLNATEHPLGRDNTFSDNQEKKIHARVNWAQMQGTIRWGGDYRNRIDEMHFEINKGTQTVAAVAKYMAGTKRGQRIKQANSHYRF
jgi:D-alanyl-D-alanine carboxypeptidase